MKAGHHLQGAVKIEVIHFWNVVDILEPLIGVHAKFILQILLEDVGTLQDCVVDVGQDAI